MKAYEETFLRALRLAQHLERTTLKPGVKISDRAVAIAQIACVRRGFDLVPRTAGLARTPDCRHVLLAMPCSDGNIIYVLSKRGRKLIMVEHVTAYRDGAEAIAKLPPVGDVAAHALTHFMRYGWPRSAASLVRKGNQALGILRAMANRTHARAMLN